ncbi:MAG: beta strand repeat-containing protein [Planctomycetota bacterium]
MLCRTNGHLLSVFAAAVVALMSATACNKKITPATPPDDSTSFNPARGFDGIVQALEAVGDGTGAMYVGGTFTNYNPDNQGLSKAGVARVKPDGADDTNFDIGTGFTSPTDIRALKVAPDASGKLYVGGWFTDYNGDTVSGLVRLNSDGTRDATFNVGTGTDNAVNAITFDSTGLIAVGAFTTYNGNTANGIFRVSFDGTFDATFATNVGGGFTGEPKAIISTTDGTDDLVVGGGFGWFDGTTTQGIVRLNGDGTLDTAVTVGYAGGGATVNTLWTPPGGTGEIVAGGDFDSFGGSGVAGLNRLNGNLTVDVSFDIGTGFNGIVRALAAPDDASNDIIVGGDFSTFGGVSAVGAVRLNNDGSRDTTFDVGVGFEAGSVKALSLFDNSFGYVVAGGDFNRYRSTSVNRIVQLEPTGALTMDFPTGATVVGTLAKSVAVRNSDGSIVVGGNFTALNGGIGQNNIAILQNDGTRDPMFDAGTGFDAEVYSVALDPGSDKFYAGGAFTTYKGAGVDKLIRLDRGGVRDTTFDTGSGFNNTVKFVVTEPGGDLYVAGDFTMINGNTVGMLTRLNSNGSVDTAFNIGTGFNDAITRIALADDGSNDLFVSGFFSMLNGSSVGNLVRLNADGTQDGSFSPGTGPSAPAFAISGAADGTGDVYLGGIFSTFNGTPAAGIVRITATGSIASGFAYGTGFNIPAYGLVPADDGSGDVTVIGDFTMYNGTAASRIVRLKASGSIDTTFTVGAGFDGALQDVFPGKSGTGDVFVTGFFTHWKSTIVQGLARLNTDGTND